MLTEGVFAYAGHLSHPMQFCLDLYLLNYVVIVSRLQAG